MQDSNGRAIYALGYFISVASRFPSSWKEEANVVFKRAMPLFEQIDALIGLLADKLVKYYRKSAEADWLWFEAYLTYDNSILPEALLMAYLAIDRKEYKEIAHESFGFLLEKTFTENRIQVVTNQGWMHKGKGSHGFGEQPVDLAGTVIALKLFHQVFKEERYLQMQTDAFNWFLGNNHLHQIVYNAATGGCYDGLEENNINLNQGAESTVSYLLARLSLIEETS